MSAIPPQLRAISLMVAATLVFVVNDTFMKLATEGLPPYQTLFLRQVMAFACCLPLVLLTGNGRSIPLVADKWVVFRNGLELIAILCFIVALANMPIADITALSQTAPLLLILGVAIVYREKIGPVRIILIIVGFAGALMVAQPGGSLSPYAILGFATALGQALRDMASRKVAAHIPGLIVALSAILVVMTGALVAHLAFEDWVAPQPRHLLLLLGSGFFLTLGHLCIFLAFREGEARAIAPLYYLFSVWALLSGALVFGTVPTPVALFGILLILGSGVLVVILDERRRRIGIVA
jgi:drug/metabolite transporter (DMT)-like permease